MAGSILYEIQKSFNGYYASKRRKPNRLLISQGLIVPLFKEVNPFSNYCASIPLKLFDADVEVIEVDDVGPMFFKWVTVTNDKSRKDD